jgi:hypothetical protein
VQPALKDTRFSEQTGNAGRRLLAFLLFSLGIQVVYI